MLILTPGPLHSLGLLPRVLFPAPMSPPWPPACSPTPLPLPISCLFSAQALLLGNPQPLPFPPVSLPREYQDLFVLWAWGQAHEPVELVPRQYGPAGFLCQPPLQHLWVTGSLCFQLPSQASHPAGPRQCPVDPPWRGPALPAGPDMQDFQGLLEGKAGSQCEQPGFWNVLSYFLKWVLWVGV